MNENCEQSAGSKDLADALLAIDGRASGSSAEGQEIAKEALRRDRRRVRVLTCLTVGFFLLTVIAIYFPVYFYYLKIAPAMEACRRDAVALEEQLDKVGAEGSKRDLLDMTARITVAQGAAFFTIHVITLWGIVFVLAVLAAAGVCTALLIVVTRRATLRQIQVSLSALSEQFDALQASLEGGRGVDSDQGT